MDDMQFRDLYKILTEINEKLSIIVEDVHMRQEEEDFENTWGDDEELEDAEWEDEWEDDRD